MTAALTGSSSVKQLEENVAALAAPALSAPALSADEPKQIDAFAVDTAGANICAGRG